MVAASDVEVRVRLFLVESGMGFTEIFHVGLSQSSKFFTHLPTFILLTVMHVYFGQSPPEYLAESVTN